MQQSNRFVFTHLGEMVSINDPIEMTRVLNQVPGVKRASNALDFLLRNVGWAIMEHHSMNMASVKFNETMIGKAAIKKMLAALFERMVIHHSFDVILYTRGIQSKVFTRMPVSECVDYLRAILVDCDAVSVNTTPISQVKSEINDLPLVQRVVEGVKRSRRPVEDIFAIAIDAGLGIGEITTYYSDPEAERFFFRHIGSSVQERMGASDRVVSTEYLGRPIERAMDPESCIGLTRALTAAINGMAPSVHHCEMEIQGRSYRYDRSLIPVANSTSGKPDYVISILSDVGITR